MLCLLPGQPVASCRPPFQRGTPGSCYTQCVTIRHKAAEGAARRDVEIKERREEGESREFYYRRGSAASGLEPGDLDEAYLQSARVLHVTGITPALSESCKATVLRAVAVAREAGVAVSLDPNIRLKLWDVETARRMLLELLRDVDIFLPGRQEAELLLGPGTPEEHARQFLDLGAKQVAVKLGPEGSLVATAEGSERVPGFPVKRVVDPIGAGIALRQATWRGGCRAGSRRSAPGSATPAAPWPLRWRAISRGCPPWRRFASLWKGAKPCAGRESR